MADTAIRARGPRDLNACVALLKRVHHLDGYPTHWPQDPARFVAPPYELEAWVAEADGDVGGHVALHAAAQDPACDFVQSASQVEAAHLAAVGRLFVGPAFRGRNVGRHLLHAATEAAHRRGQRPFLNVVQTLQSAIALYERAGWKNLGPLHIEFDDGTALDTFIFVGPPPETGS